MKHSKEKGRAPVKGRRRLEFGTPKQQLPLLNKAVYMDIKNSRQAGLMEEQLKKLGARVEKFLSVEVNYVISSSGPSKPDEKLGREENPQSPSFVPSPFNCVPSPTVQPEAKTVIVSRGKALAQIACAKNKASSVVTSAEKLGIKVVSAEAATKWLEKEIRKLKRGVESNIKENKSKKTEVKPKESKAKSKVLMGSFIKFEDNSRHYRPVRVELDRWPRLNLTAPPGICPFGEAKVKVQNLYGARNQFHETNHTVGGAAVPAVSIHAAPDPVVEKEEREEEARSVQKPAAQQELVGVPIATTGDAQRILNFHFKKNLAINKQQGYCDCCGVKFHNIDEHVKGEEHRSFARQKCNYESLDVLISQIPSTVDFLQSVVLKHCVQRHVEPTVSSGPPASQYVNLMPPISPLTTDKTNVPSQETAATCMKTPDPSGQEMATFREHFAATDTDLISKRDMVTPTKQEPVVDSRPQAVVIRRPMPSGMFTSPRRRPVTPSKKSWMQERSMVFSDSPIGSLQPSPCTSKETLPNFISDSTANTLTRLATVCDKSSTGKPNHTSEGSKATKQLFSMILNQNFATLRKKKNVTAQLGKKQTDFCQAKSGSVEQTKEMRNSPLEVMMADVDREKVELSHNENMTAEGDEVQHGAEEDKAEQSFHPEKFYSVEHEAAAEQYRIQESMMIGTESQANDSYGRKMNAKQKLEFSDIHEVCSNSHKEVIISPQTNSLVVDKEKQIDSENKSLTAEEMECTASIHKKPVNLELEKEMRDCDQDIEVTAKQKQENITSSHDTGLSFEQEQECRAVIHDKIMIVEQENKVADCNLEKTVVEQENKVADCYPENTVVGQENKVADCYPENTIVGQENKVADCNHENTVVEQENKVAYCNQENTVVEQENKVADCYPVKTIVEQENKVTECYPENTIVEQENKVADCNQENTIVEQENKVADCNQENTIVEQENKVADCNQEKDMTTRQKMEKLDFSHNTSMSVEQEQEATVLSVEQEIENTAVIHENISVEEKEVTECSLEKDMTANLELEKIRRNASMSVEQELETGLFIEQEIGCTAVIYEKFTTVEQEMECTTVIHEKIVTVEEEKKEKYSQAKDVTADQELEKLDLSSSMSVEQEPEATGLSVEQELEHKAVIHENITTVEQEIQHTAVIHENITTVEQEIQHPTVIHENITTVEQEIEHPTVIHENITTVEQEIEHPTVIHENITTVEQEIEHKAIIHENITTVQQEIQHTAVIHDNVMTVEQEIEHPTVIHENITAAEQEDKVTECSQEKDMTYGQDMETLIFSYDASKSVEQNPEVTGCNEFVIVKQDMEKLDSSCDRAVAGEREMEVTVLGQETVVAIEQRKEVVGFQHEQIVIEQEEMEMTRSIHDIDTAIEEQEVTPFSHEKTVLEQEREVMGFSHDNGVTFEQAKEMVNFSYDNSITAEQDKEVTNFSCDNITVEQETEVTHLIHNNSFTVEQEKEVIGFSHDNGVTVEQAKEMTNFCHDNSITAEQEREVTKFSRDNRNTAEKEKEDICSSHDNSITVDQETEMMGFSHDSSVSVEQAKEVTGFSHDTSITAEQAKEVTRFSHDNSITVEQAKEVTGFSHDNSITAEQAKEVTGFSHDNSITAEQAKEVTGFSHDNSITAEQAKEVTGFSHDNSITVEQAKEVTEFSHDNSITAEQAKEVTRFSHDNSITVEQAKEVTGFSHDNSITVEQAKEVTGFSHDNSITVEQAKEVTGFSHDNSSTAEQAKDVTGFSHDNIITAEQAKEVTGFSHDNSITAEQAKEVTGFSHDNSITVEQAKEVTGFSHDNSITAEQETEMTEASPDNSVTIEGEGYHNHRSMTFGNVLCGPEINCWERMGVQETEITSKKCTAVEQIMEQASHKETVMFEEKIGSNFNKEKCKTFLGKEENKTNDLNLVESITYEQAYSNNDNNINIEQEMGEIISEQDKKSICVLFETDSAHDKVEIDEEEIKEKGTSHEKMIAIDGKIYPGSNQMQMEDVEEGKAENNSNYEKMRAVEKKKELHSDQEQMENVEEGKESRSNHNKTIFQQDEDMVGYRNVFVEQKVVNASHEKRKVVGQEKGEINLNLGKSMLTENVITVTTFHNDVNIFDQEKCEAVEDKEKKRSDLKTRLSDEQGNGVKGSSHEQLGVLEEKKKEKVCNYEEDKSIDRRKERKQCKERGMSVEETATSGSTSKEEMTVDKRKERKRSNCEKHAPVDKNKRHIDPKKDACVAVEANQVKTSSDHVKALIDDDRNNMKGPCHGKCISIDEKKLTKVSKCGKEKSVERRKIRESSNHEKKLSVEEKKDKDSNHDDNMDVKYKKEKTSFLHEKVLADEQRGHRKGSNYEENKSVERRDERKSSDHKKSAPVEENVMKGSSCKANAAVEKRNERNRSNHEKHASAEETKERNRSTHEKNASTEETKERNRSNHEKHASAEETKERNRSNHEKHASAEEMKERNRSYHGKHESAEETKERNRSNHEKHASAKETKRRYRSNHENHVSTEEIRERNRSNHEKHASSEETKERNRSNHEKHASAEEMKQKNRSNHEKHVSAVEMKEKNRSNHEKHASAEEMKERNGSNHEKRASAEEMKSHLDSKHNEHKTVKNKMKKEGSDHEKRLICKSRTRNDDSSREQYVAVEEKKTTCFDREEKCVERTQKRQSSSHESSLSVEEKCVERTQKRQSSSHESSLSVEEKCVERTQKRQSSSHESSLSVEEKKMKGFSPQEGKPVEKNDAQKRSRYEKYLAEEGKNNKYSNQVSMPVEKDKKCSLHEKRLTDEQRSQQNGSKHEEDKAVEKRKERNRSSHDKYECAEETKNRVDFKCDVSMDVENKNEKISFHHERKSIDEPRDRVKCSNHDKKMAVEEKTKTTVSNHKEDKSVERNKERKSMNLEKHSACEEKRSNNEHMAVENMDKKSSHCKKALIDDQRKQKNCKREDKSVEKRNENKISNHVEEKEMKSSTCKEYMATEKRRDRPRSDYEKHQDCKHDAGMSDACKEKDSSLSGEQGNRRRSSSHETIIANEEKKEAKVSNRGEDRSVERRCERKPFKHERSVSLEGQEVRDSNCKEGLSVEKKRDRKSSNHGKHLTAEGKKSSEEYMAVESKKEMKSHHEKELAGEQRIQQKGYNQQDDQRKERKRSDEIHAVAEECKNHLKSERHEHMAVECGKEKSNHDKRLINEPRNRRSSSRREKHTAVEEHKKTKVSSHENDKSVERKEDRKLYNHERSVSVEKKEIVASNCKEDTVIEKRKERKRSNHEKHETAEEKKKNKGHESGGSMTVDKITKKCSDQEKSSKAKQEKNRKDSDNNKSSDIGKETAHRNMNPVVRICGRALGRCIVSDSLAETVYKHLAGRSLSTETSNLIYVASHKISINNLLLKGEQVSGQTSQGIDSSSANASADTACKGVLKSKSGQSCPHKHEDRSGKKTGSKICKDVDRVCVEKAVKSTTESKSTNLDKTMNADVGLSEDTDRMTCDNALGRPSNINRESSSKEKPGICKTKTRKSCRKEGSAVHGHFQEHLEKRGKAFEADKKAGNTEKYVETDRRLGCQGTGQVIGEVGEVNSRRSNTEFQNPSMKQSSEVVKSVSKPVENLNEVICNSKDSYMDEDTVDIDFYESYNLGRQNNVVNTNGLSDVHASFPYISDRAAFPHSPESTTVPTTTQPTLPPHTTQSKNESAVRACDASNSDCKLTRDQNVQQPKSSTDSDKQVKGAEVDTYTECGTNYRYTNSLSRRSSRQNKQRIYSDGRLQLSIQQRDASKGKCVLEDNILTDKEMVGQMSGDKFSEESARGIQAVSDEVSTSAITSSSVVIAEQSENPLRKGSPFEDDDDTDSLPSSENLKTLNKNGEEGIDFIELLGQLESVVVPNIAERVKSRSRLACGAPSSVVDKGVQRSDEEKKARKRRRKEFREKHRQNLLDGINSQQIEQLSDTSGKSATRNVMSNSGDKRCKNTRTHKSTPAPIVPNIAESVKNRRSCTMFNHLGQYANSGEGTDAEEENIQVKPRSAQKCRQRKYYSSRERDLKALSSKSGAEYDKNGLVKHSRVLYSQRKSNDIKIDSSFDLPPDMETDGKTSSLSGCPSKAEDESSDLSSAVVVRRKKSNVYPSNKRPEVDWGKVQPSDGSSEPDLVENSLLKETLIVAERNKTHVQSDLIKKSSHQGLSHSVTGSQASPAGLIREAKVVLVDINTSPYANIHTEAASSRYHSNIHGGSPMSPYHTNIQPKTSSSPYHAKIHTNSPTVCYPTDIHVKTSTSPYHTSIIKTPTRHYRTDSGNPVIRRSRHRKARQTETSGQPLRSKCPHSVRNISDVPSSPGISCSPRLRLKIRRRSGNKGFSSTLEEIHDCLPAASIDCSSLVDTEHCSDSCECPNMSEDKYNNRIDNLSMEPLTKHDLSRRSSSGLLPQAQYGELSQSASDVIKSSKRTREPSASYSSDSESTLEYPLNFEAVNKRIKLSPGHCTNPDVHDNYNADNHRNEVSPYITAQDTSANTSLPRDPIWAHSSNRFRSSSPCFSSPVTKRQFKCFTTPKKSDAVDGAAAGSESPVFNLSMKRLRHTHSTHSIASAHGLSGDSAPQADMSYLALQNAGLQASVILESSMTLKQTAGRNLSSKRSLSPPDLNLPSAKKTKVDASCRVTAERPSVQLEIKQESAPLQSCAESSNHGFYSLLQGAPKFNPAADFKRTVNPVLSSHSASTSQRGLTSVPPFAEAPQLDLKSFDSTEWLTCTTTDRNMKPANPRESDEDTVMLLEIDGFSGVSDLGFEDLLSQVHTFSSPDKAADTSWGDICDTYLSTSFNNHHIHNAGQPGLGQSPAGRGAKVVSFSPCRKQFKNCSSPLSKGLGEESVKGQTGSGHHSHVIKQKATVGPERTMSKNQSNYSGLDTAVEKELQTPVKNADTEDLKFSPYIQQVDEVISFNFMSPQRIKFSPHQTYSSTAKLPVSPQTEHRRSQNASHSRRLFSPAKTSPQRVNSSPRHTHRSTLQSLLSPQAEHQKSHTASHSRRLFSPHSPQSVYVSPHHTQRSTLQSELSSQAEHQRPHAASHSKRLFSPHSPQSAYVSPHHTRRSILLSELSPQAEHRRPHTASHSKRLFSPHSPQSAYCSPHHTHRPTL